MTDEVLYETDGRIAHVTLNRPDRFNAITESMPGALAAAIDRAEADDEVRVIVLEGAGEAFCSGYDLELFAERPRPVPGSQEMPWDPMADYRLMKGFTENYMRIWHSHTPVICKIDGPAVAGGSDIALCADVVLMSEDATIGYPPARVWGCPTTMLWVYRLGPGDAKRMLLTGDLIDGIEAERMGLIHRAYPDDELDDAVAALAKRVAGIPANQLMMQKLAVNTAYENMGLETSQTLATIFDGMARHTPEGIAFKDRCEEVGFEQAVRERDRGDLF
ncbi:crotonase/enoyl-CoA hydratase family protein [Halosolutus halophilus]|uniref:crotonase/enoyl-CoA hydratase family protein n=1 Tax=Halosolutus halophilus TaxID=1552990 RepID=UPI0022351A45|nr:crotonase/enoyl-CoA hydratase family protein [Halosolutus halophilus]